MAARATGARKTAARPKGARIRMYRQGFGDCLLLDLPGRGRGRFRMLIDCGVLWGSPDAVARMREVVRDVAAETRGRVDVLVVTHEHWDHVSGFEQAREFFADAGAEAAKGQLAVGEVWLAWTEDPADPLAHKLRAEKKARLNALLGLVGMLGEEAGPATGPLAKGLSDVLGFFALSAAATGNALAVAKSLAPNRYLRPSDPPWQDARAPGIRIFTLGPPPDETLIRRLRSASELYHGFADPELAESFLVALADRFGFDKEMAERQELFYPFDAAFRLPTRRDAFDHDAGVHAPEDLASLRKLLEQHYWGGDAGWRRIDDDWLGGAAELALHLDAATNNTSLVLAVELVETGRVLLFVGDAQVGNWLSWHDLKWKLEDDGEVTGPDLLSRTVFYKVGHHGSHNATLKAKGLEAMSREDFVAFVPVDEETARSRGWSRIPLQSLMDALSERGLVVRSDLGLPKTEATAAERLKQTPLYIEYTVPL